MEAWEASCYWEASILAVRRRSNGSQYASMTLLQKSPSRKQKSNPQSTIQHAEGPFRNFCKTQGLFRKIASQSHPSPSLSHDAGARRRRRRVAPPPGPSPHESERTGSSAAASPPSSPQISGRGAAITPG